MKTQNLLSAFLILFLFFSCKNEDVKTDNIYKFKEYISYTTSGIVSKTEKITVNLTKEVENWETDQDISSDIISIKPFVNGKIKTLNKHALFLFRMKI